jgi:hypothetical protein
MCYSKFGFLCSALWTIVCFHLVNAWFVLRFIPSDYPFRVGKQRAQDHSQNNVNIITITVNNNGWFGIIFRSAPIQPVDTANAMVKATKLSLDVGGLS